MRISRLRLVNFRRFEDEDLHFSPGLNLVRGPNESGKSTIVRALIAAMFEKPGASNARSRLDARWGATRQPWIEMDFTDEDGEYRLFKDFGEKRVALEQPGDAKPLASAKAVDARIAELIGFRDPGQYLRTACVTHDQMESLGQDGSSAKKLASMLREIVVGSRESGLLEKAVRNLGAEVEELKRGSDRPTNNPGTIRRLQDEREMYIARQKDLAGGATDFAEQRERLAVVEAEVVEKSAELADLASVIEKNRRLAEVERLYDEARTKFEAADRIQAAAVDLEAIDAEIKKAFPDFEGLDESDAAELHKAIEVRESLKSLADELAVVPQTNEEEQERPRRPVRQPQPRGRGVLSIAAGFILLVLGVVLGATVHPALFSIVAPGALLLALGSYYLAQARPVEAEPHVETGESSEMDERLSRAGAEVSKLDQREREFLESVGCKDASEFFERFEEYRDLLDKRREAATALKALLGRKTPDQIESQRRDAAIAVSACDEKLGELAGYKLSPQELEAAERKHKLLASEVSELETERDGLSFHLVKTASDPEEAIKISEILSWLWEAEQSARRRLRVYSLARDAMVMASEEMLSSAVPVLAESVALTFSRLTDGRYDTVEVREGDLAISVYSQEKEETIPADEVLSTLSKGTASQLYLSARLELVDLLSGGRKPPLIFDDSFSYFDKDRLELLWKLLEEVSEHQQVLVLTCTDRYDELARGVNVVELSR